MIETVNLQRKVKLNSKPLALFGSRLATADDLFIGKRATVAFISDDRMRKLNNAFRGKDSTTDVLSFPYEPDDFQVSDSAPHGADAAGHAAKKPDANSQLPVFLGDIVISAEQAQKQAAENGLDLETEIKQLILHGLLHLCGYDHETDNGEMNARELELRDHLGI